MGTGSTSVTTKAGDFDGNGVADTLRAYLLGSDWHIRVELAAGGGADAVVPGTSSASAVKAIGGFNLDGDIRDEVFAVVGTGAATVIVGLWTFRNCQLIRITLNGQPAEFPVGATVRNLSGLKCVQGTALQALEGQSAPSGSPFTVKRTNYDLVGSALVVGSSPPTSTVLADDPSLGAFGRFDCGSLTLN